MLLIKKLILANVLGAGIAVPTVTYTKQGEKTETLELGSTLKRWNQLLNHISGKNSFEKISKVFSENLTTFSNSAVVNAVKHILMKWATEIWENQEAYFPISQRLNKFFFYYHIHQWQVKKEIEELSWELIKKFFIDFFFKDKGWFLLENFGDFSSFALQEWEKKERPMKVYEWTLKYSNAGENQQVSSSEDSLYDSSVLDSAKNKHSYLFPQIQASEEYSSFISKFTHTGEIDLSYFKKTWTTVSELSTLTDGYKLGSLIHLYSKKDSFNSEESVVDDAVITELKLKKSPSEKLQASENPLYLFLKEDAQNCLTIQNSLFNEKINKQLNGNKGKPTCLYGVRWLTPENGDSGSKKTILVSREQDGISFYYLTDESGLKNGTGNQKSLTQQETEVIEKVTKFVEKNFENLFLKFLFSKSNCNYDESSSYQSTFFSFKSTGTVSSKTWDFSEFLGKNLKILCASTDYLDSLYWGQTIQKLQSILLSVYKNIPQEYESQDRSKSKGFQLPTKAGLFSPLTYKRNSNENNGHNEEIDFFALRENGEDRDGRFFADIMHFLFNNQKEKKIFSLEEKAHNLRELLLGEKNEKRLFQSDSLDNLFLSESFYRTQLEAIAGDKLKASHTIFVSKSKDILSTTKNAEDLEKGNFSSWLSQLINSLGQDTTQTENSERQQYQWSDLINKSLFLEPLLKRPLEKKIFYGTFGQVSSEESETDSSNLNNLSIRAKNDWILDNFYLSDSAYESSSEAYQDFLAFLVSIKWMTHNNYSNIAKVINYILSKNENKNAYLIWTKEITEKQKEEIEKGKEEEGGDKSLKKNLKKS
ncbi:hypothetical protein OVS_01300 [Mycoplasma ovis str. Michigan]|uniref:DUF31 domain-containing protein n=1 Tax=Mycoplasma ovis str. Michigan TaxID=1415773 RepID=A0ABM5P1C0_9MOLU|nr:DUF3713 domain-containing protein [Mycoplasma ovis]AHC40191.1 hypothetical protein OVS_01300 [Mycoplasma ovis str. Michigan]